MTSEKSPTWLRGLSYGLGLTLGGAFVIGQALLYPSDRTTLLIQWGLGGLCVLAGAWNLWRWWRGDCVAQPISLPEEVHLLPDDQQIEYLQRTKKISLVAFPMLSVYIAFQLTQLERGQVDSVMLWAPIILLYQNLGYWPAVCATPLLGVLTFIGLSRRVKELCTSNSKHDHRD